MAQNDRLDAKALCRPFGSTSTPKKTFLRASNTSGVVPFGTMTKKAHFDPLDERFSIQIQSNLNLGRKLGQDHGGQKWPRSLGWHFKIVFHW